MTADLKATIERMRERAGYGWREFAISSADALLLLTALDQAAEALKPFAEESDTWTSPALDMTGPAYIATSDDGSLHEALFSMSDLRRAATVYATLKPADTKEGEG